MVDLMKLGQTLRIKRTENNLSSGDAAQKLKLSPAYYSRLENGKEKPSPDLLNKIAVEYNLPLEDQRLLSQLAGYTTNAESEGGNTSVATQALQEVQIKVNAEALPVLFSDSMFVTVSENGVVFDFAQKVGPTNEQQIVTRVGVSYNHAEKIHKLLGQQLKAAKDIGIES